LKLAERATDELVLLVNISGRGDKDMAEAERHLGTLA
jgi:tryptophan synthase beta subunit